MHLCSASVVDSRGYLVVADLVWPIRACKSQYFQIETVSVILCVPLCVFGTVGDEQSPETK